MEILLTNDDGIHAPGLWALYKRLSLKHRTHVVAPDRERSAVGFGITLNEPLRIKKIQMDAAGFGYAVTGTPVDCVKLALLELFETRPDMVISGINPGANVGVNINYSGTVSAAREAALFGIPSIAVSITGNESMRFVEAALFIEVLVEKVNRRRLPFGTTLNVNIPNLPLREVAGVRITRQCLLRSNEQFEKRRDPRNRDYYWPGGELSAAGEQPDADGAILERKYISISPVKCDMTDDDFIEDLRQWEFQGDLETANRFAGSER